MSRWTGQIARHGITVQAAVDTSLEPGWLDGYVRSGTSVPGWMNTALANNGVGRPRWASDIPGGRRIFVYDLHRGYSRVVGHSNRIFDLNADINLEGISNSFVVDLSAAGPNNASNKGLNRGARIGNITYRVRAWARDNGQLLIDQGTISSTASDGIHRSTYAMSSWSSYWHPWSRRFTASRPVGRVLVNTRAIQGVEDYHTVSDRSPAASWNPTHNIGNYFSYNYFSLIGINEVPSYYASHASVPKHNTFHGVEYERRMDVLDNNGNVNTNVHSQRRTDLYLY